MVKKIKKEKEVYINITKSIGVKLPVTVPVPTLEDLKEMDKRIKKYKKLLNNGRERPEIRMHWD